MKIQVGDLVIWSNSKPEWLYGSWLRIKAMDKDIPIRYKCVTLKLPTTVTTYEYNIRKILDKKFAQCFKSNKLLFIFLKLIDKSK